MLGDRLVNRMVEIWLKTEFEGGRHARRLEKIALYEHHTGAPTTLGSNSPPPA
ncbi:MAG TPA: RpiB/LacA/LacB family sugar-phosphate isomerase [Planctomycetaceae bacterium]|nr:RpiB/LacA/LacB family sugar-phosphate isomerase [Planctomycetaceae bacterium]